MSGITLNDITDYIWQNFEVRVPLQDLKAPNGMFVVNVCNLFLSGFGLQQTEQPSFEARVNCPPGCMELSPEDQLLANVCRMVRVIVNKVGFQVLPADFILPTKERVCALLIALCQCYERFIKIKEKMNQIRQSREPIYEEKERLKARLVDIKSEHESACIALNQLNNEDTETHKTENRDLEAELGKLKKLFDEKREDYRKIQGQNREVQEAISKHEINIAQKKETKRAEAEKIIQSPMKTINAAKTLRAKMNTLQGQLKDLHELENEKKKVLAKEEEITNDVLPQFLIKIESLMNGFFDARGQYETSKEIEDSIQKTIESLNAIQSQVDERKMNITSHRSTNNQVIDKITSNCESVNQLINDIEEDLPNKMKEREQQNDKLKAYQEKVKQLQELRASLPDKQKALHDKYVA